MTSDLQRLVEAVCAVLHRTLTADAIEKATRYRWHLGDKPTSFGAKLETYPRLKLLDYTNSAATIAPLLSSLHPSLPSLVGTSMTGLHRLDAARLLQVCAGLFVDSGEKDLEGFVGRLLARDQRLLAATEQVVVTCIAPTPGLAAPPGAVAHLGEVVLREFSEREFGDFYLDPLGLNVLQQPSRWALFTEISTPLLVGDDENLHSVQPVADDRLLVAHRALRLASGQGIGGQQRSFVMAPSVLAMGTSSLFDPARQGGSATLGSEQLAAAESIAQRLTGKLHPALQVAIGRLDASLFRRDQRDRVIDSVIGLEAILLADVGEPAYRGELRFRFALHASSLEASPARRHAMHRAFLAVYDLRSALAHGALVPTSVRVGATDRALPEVTTWLTEQLRTLIVRFLPDGPTPGFASPGFWRNLYYGGPEDPEIQPMTF
jgi:Apea-like HEPN